MKKQFPLLHSVVQFNKNQERYTNADFVDLKWSPNISYNSFLELNVFYDHSIMEVIYL